MGYRTLLTILVSGVLGGAGGGLAAQAGSTERPMEARLWVGWQDEPVVRRGEQVRVQFNASEDAFVAVFRIDTDGRVQLLTPVDPRDDGYRSGGRNHELVLRQSPYWTVADDPGMGYMFLVASPVPFDLGAFGFHPDFGWDLSAVATAVYDDPYLAMDDFIAAILPGWQDIPYALDFVTYHVDAPRSYPRFLCYDCHTYRSFDQWNPYEAMCSSYRVVVYDDPYFYPLYRYAGTRVVYPRPIPDRPRYEMTARSGEAWAPIVRVRAAPARVTFKESPSATSAPRMGATATGRAVRPGTRPAVAGPSTRGSAPRASEPRATGRSVPTRGTPAAGTGRAPSERAAPAGRRGAPTDRSRVAPSGSGSRPSAAPSRRATGRPSARSSPPGRGAGPAARPGRPSAASARSGGRGGAAAARSTGRASGARPSGRPGPSGP